MKTASTRTKAAALVAATALTLGITAQAASAAEPTQPGQTSGSASQQVWAKPKTIKSLKRALAKAKRAEKQASQAVSTSQAALTTAQESGASAVSTYQAAFTAADEARGKHRPAKAALDRAQYVVTNEQALFDELFKRVQAAEAAAKPLKDARDAASAKVTELRNTENAILAQRTTASQNQSAAATVAGNLGAYDIPAAQDQYRAAVAAETNAWNAKEAARVDFANRKAQWDDTRKSGGKWQGLRNGTWRFVPGLDDAEALLDQRQAAYNQAKNQRQDIEGYLGVLNQKAANAQADIAYWAAQFSALNDQYNAARANTSAASTAYNQAREAYDAYVKANIEPLYDEADALWDEISAAKKNLPALIAAEKPLAEAVTQAVAALDAATPAYQQAQGQIDAASTGLATATSQHATAQAKVKALKKAIKKAIKKGKKGKRGGKR